LRRESHVAEPDPAPLSRTLLRLRHDFVIIGRALVELLPAVLAPRLTGTLARLSTSADDFLRSSARALASRRRPPPIEPVRYAFAAYNCDLLALRKEGLTTTLSSGDLERLFALGFAFDQLHQNS